MNHVHEHPVIEINELVYRYPKASAPALVINHLSILKDQQIVLTGQSGCGKSTLLHLIAGLMSPAMR